MSLLMFGSRGFDTTTISGAKLAIWIKPDGIVHDGTNITSWRNDGTLGGSFTQSTSAKRFRVDLTGNPIGGPCARVNATNDSYMIADSVMLPVLNGKTGGTSVVVWKTTGTSTQCAIQISDGSSGDTNRFTVNRQSDSAGNGAITQRLTGNGIDGTFENTFGSITGVFTDDVWASQLMTNGVPGQFSRGRHNGQLVQTEWVWYGNQGSGYSATDSVGIKIGASGATGQYDRMLNRMCEVLVFDAPITAAQENQVLDYIHNKYNLTKVYGNIDLGVLWIGHSIMQGLVRGKDKIPNLVMAALPNPTRKWFRNQAITGMQIQQIQADIDSSTRRFNQTRDLPPGLSGRDLITVGWLGTNNVASGSESAGTAYARVPTLLDALTTERISVDGSNNPRNRIIATDIPRTDATVTTRVFAFNTKLYDNYYALCAKGVEGLVYTGQLSQFDDGDDPLAGYPTYYQSDSSTYIHPTAAGNALLYPLFTPQVNQVSQRRAIETNYGSYIKGWYRSGRVDSGSTIATMYNIASNGSNYDATQSTSTRKATYTSNSRLGYPGVTFSGSATPNNTRLSLGSSGLDQINGASTVLAVFCFKVASATPAANETIYMASINPSNSTVRLAIQHTTGNKIIMAARAGDFGSAATLTSTTSIGTGICVVSCLFDMANTDAYVWLNGTADGSNTSFNNGGGTAIASNNAGHISFGSLGSESNPGAFTLYEFLLLKDPPNPTAARDDIETMLGNTYTVTVA